MLGPLRNSNAERENRPAMLARKEACVMTCPWLMQRLLGTDSK